MPGASTARTCLKFIGTPGLNLLSYLIPMRLAARQVLRLAYYDPSRITKEQLDAYTEPLSMPGARHALLQTASQLVPSGAGELIKKYKDIQLPTLIIWGRQDQIIPVKVGELLAYDLPKSSLKIIEQCGHAPQEEKPEETIRLVMDFLRSL